MSSTSDFSNSINNVLLSKELRNISMEDWIYYIKIGKEKKNDKEFMEKFNFIKFKAIDDLMQILSYFNSDPNAFDENLKKLLLDSWWRAALIDKEEFDSLVHAYNVGTKLVEKSQKNIELLQKIIEYIQK